MIPAIIPENFQFTLLTVSTSTLSLSQNSGTVTLDVTSNTQWTASTSDSWITFPDGATQTGNFGAFPIDIAEEPTGDLDYRVGNVTFGTTDGVVILNVRIYHIIN
jgi:hypothetical protein